MHPPEYKILYINVNFFTGAQKCEKYYYLYVLNLCVDRRLHNKLQQTAQVSAADTDNVWESVVDSVTNIISDFLYANNLHKGKSYTLTAWKYTRNLI